MTGAQPAAIERHVRSYTLFNLGARIKARCAKRSSATTTVAAEGVRPAESGRAEAAGAERYEASIYAGEDVVASATTEEEEVVHEANALPVAVSSTAYLVGAMEEDKRMPVPVTPMGEQGGSITASEDSAFDRI